MVSETTFTHQPLQVYGEDPYWDPDAFRTVVTGLTYDETNELRHVAKFVDGKVGQVLPRRTAPRLSAGSYSLGFYSGVTDEPVGADGDTRRP